jgi:PAS domain S-box-containing protein
MGTLLRVLIVEDSENDTLLLLRELRRGGYEPEHVRVDTAADMEAALIKRNWDLVISDHSMPSFSSSAALELLQRKGFDLPFIIVSGKIGEETAVEAMKAGAHDYIMKDNLARLNTAIERELREAEVRRERRRAEEALKESETRFRLMIEQSPLGIQILSPDGRSLRVNQAWERLWGVTLDQISDYNVLQDPQLVEKGIMPYIERGFAGQPTAIPPAKYEPGETILNVSDVSHRWVRAFIYPVKDAVGNIQEVVLVHEDITESREAEEARRRAEEKYRSIFENAVEGIFQTMVDGKFLTANPALARMFGFESPEELLATISDVEHQLYVNPERRAEFGRLVREEGFVKGFEIQMYRKDGSVMWASVSARAARDASGEVAGYEGFVEDITRRKRAEEALREIREAERRRIARDLHDEAMQDLAFVLQSLQLAQLTSEDRETNGGLKQEIAALRRTVAGLRNAVYDLRLGSENRSFLRSLESLVELNRQIAPERELELAVEDGFPSEFAGEARIELLRIIQEALVNVRRHSGASHARVTLGGEGGEVWAEIADNGQGFDPGKGGAGVGLTGMHERASAIGGELEIKSEPGKGTEVRFHVALPALIGSNTDSL